MKLHQMSYDGTKCIVLYFMYRDGCNIMCLLIMIRLFVFSNDVLFWMFIGEYCEVHIRQFCIMNKKPNSNKERKLQHVEYEWMEVDV